MENKSDPADVHPRSTKDEAAPDAAPTKPFVEPTISNPVNVLEATTYFQAIDSGGSGLRPEK